MKKLLYSFFTGMCFCSLSYSAMALTAKVKIIGTKGTVFYETNSPDPRGDLQFDPSYATFQSTQKKYFSVSTNSLEWGSGSIYIWDSNLNPGPYNYVCTVDMSGTVTTPSSWRVAVNKSDGGQGCSVVVQHNNLIVITKSSSKTA